MIENGKVVAIEYTVYLEDGSKVDSNVGDEPLTYRQGEREILPKLEDELLGLTEGDTRSVTLAPADAYGEIQEEGFQAVDASLVPENAREVGAVLQAVDDSGNRRQVRVAEISEDVVVLDLNHPLAGQTLTFEVRILNVD